MISNPKSSARRGFASPVPFGAVIERYLAQELPERNSTASRYRSWLGVDLKVLQELLRQDVRTTMNFYTQSQLSVSFENAFARPVIKDI